MGRRLILESTPNRFFRTVPENVVLMGEALVYYQTGKILPRAGGNALITQGINGEVADLVERNLVFQLWDVVSLEDFRAGSSKVPYVDRFNQLRTFFYAPNEMVVETRAVNSKEEAEAHYREIRRRYDGEDKLEGTVVKDQSAMWKDGTSPLQVKMKAEKECEVQVIGWTPGKPGSKYEGKLGSLLVSSSCGWLEGSVSGMTDADREGDPDRFLNRIITVRFNEVSKNKNTSKRSFDHARFIELRQDKNEADSLEYILKL
jgi:ATP-dependent DNA ligase